MNGNDNNSQHSDRTKVSDDISPVKQYTQEEIMNSVNNSSNGTIISVDVENDVKKKVYINYYNDWCVKKMLFINSLS